MANAAAKPTRPDHPLLDWVEEEVAAQRTEVVVDREAEVWGGELGLLYQSARLLQALPAGVRAGPSPSQWGRVMETAKRPGLDTAGLRRLLFGGDHAVCKGTEWETRLRLEVDGSPAYSFREWLERRIDGIGAKGGGHPPAAAVVVRVARRGVSVARGQEESK